MANYYSITLSWSPAVLNTAKNLPECAGEKSAVRRCANLLAIDYSLLALGYSLLALGYSLLAPGYHCTPAFCNCAICCSIRSRLGPGLMYVKLFCK